MNLHTAEIESLKKELKILLRRGNEEQAWDIRETLDSLESDAKRQIEKLVPHARALILSKLGVSKICYITYKQSGVRAYIYRVNDNLFTVSDMNNKTHVPFVSIDDMCKYLIVSESLYLELSV